MSEINQPGNEVEAGENTSIFEEIAKKASRYRELSLKQAEGLSEEEIAERNAILKNLRSYEKTKLLSQKMSDLRKIQISAVKEEDFSQKDMDLLYGLQLIFGEAE